MHEIYIEWCKKEGIHTIADLKDRVVPHKEYEIVWHKRCEKMHKDLEAERKLRTHETKPDETK